MDFNSTVKGSALEGFYPEGWDFKKIDACIGEPETITDPQNFWNKEFTPVKCDSLGEFETYMGHEIAMQIRLAKERNEKIAFILPVGPMGMYKWVVYFLKEWQECFDGDSFVFDYHLMWDHHTDPGYYNVAKTLHSDMANLDKIGINGMISCQLLRSAFPTGLPQYCMASALWNKTRSFEEIKDEYFTAAFGENAKAVDDYLAKVSNLACPEFVRGKIIPGFKDFGRDEVIRRYSELKEVVKAFSEKYIEAFKDTSNDWQYLRVHAILVCLFAEVYMAKYCGDEEKVKDLSLKFRTVVNENKNIIDSVCDDMYLCDDVLMKYLDRHTPEEDAPPKPIVYEY